MKKLFKISDIQGNCLSWAIEWKPQSLRLRTDWPKNLVCSEIYNWGQVTSSMKIRYYQSRDNPLTPSLLRVYDSITTNTYRNSVFNRALEKCYWQLILMDDIILYSNKRLQVHWHQNKLLKSILISQRTRNLAIWKKSIGINNCILYYYVHTVFDQKFICSLKLPKNWYDLSDELLRWKVLRFYLNTNGKSIKNLFSSISYSYLCFGFEGCAYSLAVLGTWCLELIPGIYKWKAQAFESYLWPSLSLYFQQKMTCNTYMSHRD